MCVLSEFPCSLFTLNQNAIHISTLFVRFFFIIMKGMLVLIIKKLNFLVEK